MSYRSGLVRWSLPTCSGFERSSAQWLTATLHVHYALDAAILFGSKDRHRLRTVVPMKITAIGTRLSVERTDWWLDHNLQFYWHMGSLCFCCDYHFNSCCTVFRWWCSRNPIPPIPVGGQQSYCLRHMPCGVLLSEGQQLKGFDRLPTHWPWEFLCRGEFEWPVLSVGWLYFKAFTSVIGALADQSLTFSDLLTSETSVWFSAHRVAQGHSGSVTRWRSIRYPNGAHWQ